MRSWSVLAVVGWSCLLLSSGTARAGDLTLRQRTTTTAGGQSHVRDEMQYVHDGLLVIDAPDTRTIVDVDARTMTVADKARRTYMVMTFDDVKRQAEEVQRRADRMPPDVKSMLDDMLGAGKSIAVTPTGKQDNIAGYSAREFVISGGPFRGSIWTTDTIALPEGVRRWRELAASATAQAGPARPLAEALAKVQGTPLRTGMAATLGRDDSFTTATEVLEVRTAAPPADVLRVPPGFTKTAAPTD
jgi:hypothetical protein